MAKLFPVKFLKAFDRYNAGEVAGFEEVVARKLFMQDVAKPYDKDEEAAELAKTQAEADALAIRAADLDAREAALAEREKQLAEAGASGNPPDQGAAKK